jgi:nitrate reductase NapE component
MMELSFSAMAAMVLFPLLWLALVLVYGYQRNKSWKAPKKC